MCSRTTVAWACFLLLGLCTCEGALDHQQASHEWLIGWQGESYSPLDTWNQMQGNTVAVGVGPPAEAPTKTLPMIDLSQQPQSDGRPWVQLLSWQPRLHLHHNFMTPQEADQLLALVTGKQQQQQADGPVAELEDELLYRLEQRIANWTFLPPTHIEGWQVHHGANPSEHHLHMDLQTDRLATEDFQRLRTATVLLFLSDSDPAAVAADSAAGGSSSSSGWSIVFPHARSGNSREVTQPEDFREVVQQGQQVQQQLVAAGLSSTNTPDGRHRQASDMLLLPGQPSSSSSSTADPCAAGSSSSSSGLRLTGFRKGSALLIWNMLIDGRTPDASAAHLVCPSMRGSNPANSSSGSSSRGDIGWKDSAAKPWIATTWFHNMPVEQDDVLGLAATCADKNPACRVWASQGFCDDAPGVLLGLRGMCRLSCNDCHMCQKPQKPVGSSLPDSHPAADESLSTDSRHGGQALGLIHTGIQGSSSQDGSLSGVSADGLHVVAASSAAEYVECLYENMHSLRAEWSEQARGAGVRRARNAIRRDLRGQAVGLLVS